MSDDPVQETLVPLTDEERATLPARLAESIRELEELEAEHKELRAEQAAERKAIRNRISSLASQIRNNGR